MRPLQRKPEVAEWASNKQCLPALLTELGPYCRVCEIPLTDRAVVIDFRMLEAIDPNRAIEDRDRWLASYPVCDACAQAFDRFLSRRVAVLQRPSRAADQMTLEKLDWSVKSPPIHYAPEKLTKVVEENGQVVDRTDVEIVLAFPSKENTTDRHFVEFLIDLFAINSPGIDYHDRTLTVNENSELVLNDRRVEHRTRAWDQALKFCQRLRDVARNSNIEPLQIALNDSDISGRWWGRQARLLAGHTGFWSVWATVLWNEFQNEEFVVRCLWNENDVDDLAHFSPENPFPATLRYRSH